MIISKRWVNRGGTDGKRPFGKCNDSSTWRTFEEAVKKGSGKVAFALSADDDLVALDLDGCFDEAGTLHEKARAILDLCHSYTEVSMSGKGLHIFGKARLPFPGRKKGPLEIYGENRFIAMTGNIFENRQEIRDIQDGVDTVVEMFFREMEQKPKGPKYPDGGPEVAGLDDRALLDRIAASRQGSKFLSLWKGVISGYESQSEADLALCDILAFWTGCDRRRIDSLFRQSGLMRPKWDRKLRPGRTYGDWTVEKSVMCNA